MAELDPVAAYDRIAPVYARISERRRAYLDAVERLAVSEVSHGSRSLLDVGAGDGTRSVRIARAAGIDEVTLVEPSTGMRELHPLDVQTWAIRAEDLHTRKGVFDVIVCLWNVLGHIFPAEARLGVLRELGRLVAPNGRILIDVNHRYNARHYGFFKTALRFARDLGAATGTHGDVQVTWDVERGPCSTKGHVFTDREVHSLARATGLRVMKRYALDYETGELRRSIFAGNLMYVLAR